MSIEYRRLGPTIGAEVRGVSLAEVPDAATVEAIEDAIERYGVLVFPEQVISPAEQVAFSRAFALLEQTTWVDARLDGHPEIFVVGNTGPTVISFASVHETGDLEWHADHMHLAVPARASLLYAREVPPAGGDTLFACMYGLFEGLDAAEKATLDGLVALHSISGLKDYLRAEGEAGAAEAEISQPADLIVRRPLVRTHPRSGRKSLYFGSKASIGIEGWPRRQALTLFDRLSQQCLRPELSYRHRWAVGDALLWDNRRVLHAALFCDLKRYRRELHRTTWREDRPFV